MDKYETVGIWNRTLGNRAKDPHQQDRERLRVAYQNFRSHVETLVGEIGKVLPTFTVHDITHLDALWEMADLVAGDNFELTPAEAFVLGGGILLHDAGMALAAYPQRFKDIERDDLWRDILAGILRRDIGKAPTTQALNNPSEQQKKQALQEFLRQRHADKALQLATQHWCDRNGEQVFLLEDKGLRNHYGELIGKVARSHHFTVQQLATELPQELSVPGFLPANWTVDPIKVACLLRVADACHVDDRRAPWLLRLFRPELETDPVAPSHWSFQERMGRPRTIGDRLVFTSSRDFEPKDCDAWWVAHDWLKMVDDELRGVDALLKENNLPRLVPHGVKGIESPDHLQGFLQTKDWTPVDARIHISNVSRVVENLGGQKLYGENQLVPLRELIQNAADAIRARRALENRETDWGRIVIRFGQDAGGAWIEVQDDGIGMSQETLAGSLLDFGTSYWTTAQCRREHPGLMATSFQPTGQFGIGFFSLFMLGNQLNVTSRSCHKGKSETAVLEFRDGFRKQPLLRAAEPAEQLTDPGTRIRVWLKAATLEKAGLPDTCGKFARISAWLAPTLDVTLQVQPPKGGKLTEAVRANDWIDMHPTQFLQRIGNEDLTEPENADLVSTFASHLRPLKESDDTVVGRCTIVAHGPVFDSKGKIKSIRFPGVVTVGGFRACSLHGIAGAFIGDPLTANRFAARPMVTPSVLAAWASEQARLLGNIRQPEETQRSVAQHVRRCGGRTGALPVFLDIQGQLRSSSEIAEQAREHARVLWVEGFRDPYAPQAWRQGRLSSTCPVIFRGYGLPTLLNIDSAATPVSWNERFWPEPSPENPLYDAARMWFSIMGEVIECLAQVWGCTREAILEASTLLHTQEPEVEIATLDGQPILEPAHIIRRPTAQ